MVKVVLLDLKSSDKPEIAPKENKTTQNQNNSHLQDKTVEKGKQIDNQSSNARTVMVRESFSKINFKESVDCRWEFNEVYDVG